MSSSPIDIVKVFYGTLSLMGAKKAGAYLASDFTLAGMAVETWNKDAWLGFLYALKNALPDMKTRLTKVVGTGNDVHITETSMGTHVADMDMSGVGYAEIPASGMFITFPSAEWILTVTDGKISHAEFVSPLSPDSGFPGMRKAFSAHLGQAD